MPLDLFDETRALIAALEQESVPYALCGGVALAIHGVVRATVDVDLLVREEDLDRARAAAGSCGFDVPALPLEFANGIRIHRLTKLVDADSLCVDFLIVAPLLETVFEDRMKIETESGPLSVVSRESLIAMKSLAGREQDLADIRRLREVDS